MNKSVSHEGKVQKLTQELKRYAMTTDPRTVRFSHGSTNSTRVRDISDSYTIDISSFDEILQIDTVQKVAIVEPNVPMDRLVKECLKYGLMPPVVMEFPGITCGGGVNGAALEASSYRYGQFNDTCIEYECVLGDGTVLTANEHLHADLFYGISGSYGSLALLTKITISLLPAKQYAQVHFHQVPTDTVVSQLERLVREDKHDYLEALIFTPHEAVIISGDLVDAPTDPLVTFHTPTDEWFYLYAAHSAKNQITTITTPLADYLFRYDRGAFWMGKHAFAAFHMPFNRLTRTMLDPLMHTRTLYTALHSSNAAQEYFIQDFYIPLSQAQLFISFSTDTIGIFPLWLCPLKSTSTPQVLSPHYLSEDILIDVGIWGKIPSGKERIALNKEFEECVAKIGGRKMLYAETFYSEDSFWSIYDRDSYLALRSIYKASHIFPTVWEKVHVKKTYAINKWKGLRETVKQMVFNR